MVDNWKCSNFACWSKREWGPPLHHRDITHSAIVITTFKILFISRIFFFSRCEFFNIIVRAPSSFILRTGKCQSKIPALTFPTLFVVKGPCFSIFRTIFTDASSIQHFDCWSQFHNFFIITRTVEDLVFLSRKKSESCWRIGDRSLERTPPPSRTGYVSVKSRRVPAKKMAEGPAAAAAATGNSTHDHADLTLFRG